MVTCALVIGHKKHAPGAVNQKSQLTEFDYNEKLAIDIERHTKGVNIQRVYRRTLASLPNDINELAPNFIISLHCNAFNQEVSGTETLYYYRSTFGQQLAQLLQSKIVAALNLNDRGIKAKTAEDRGGYLLKLTDAPCVIAEPFFIDNDYDLTLAQDKHSALVNAYAQTIEEIAVYFDNRH